MQENDPKHKTEILEILDKLIKIDDMHQNYYKDLKSDTIISQTEKDTKKIVLNNLSLTRMNAVMK